MTGALALRPLSIPTLLTAGLLLGCAGRAAADSTAVAPLSVDFSWYRQAANTAYVYLRNPGNTPITFEGLSVDGHSESAEPWPLAGDRKTHWFDCVPATIPPQGIAQVRVNLRDPKPGASISLQIKTDHGTLTQRIDPDRPALQFSDVGVSGNGSEITLFLSDPDVNVVQVAMDGIDVTDHCDLRGGRSFAGTAVVVLRPAQAVKHGSYHVLAVRSADQRRAVYAVHMRRNDFVLGTYGDPKFLDRYRADGLNTYVAFRMVSPETLRRAQALGLGVAPVPFVAGDIGPASVDDKKTALNLNALKPSDSIRFYGGMDEPDGSDHANHQLGMNARALVRERQLAEAAVPSAETFLQIDNSYRPRNYQVYAETMDYSATHRYNLGGPFLADDREAADALRACSQPQPYLWVDQLYPLRQGDPGNARYDGRDPAPEEMHLQMLEAVANGAKGIIHYIHSGSVGGRGGSGTNAALWDAMKAMHEQLAVVGPIVACSTPTSWAAAARDDFRAVALLGGLQDLVVVVTNQAVSSTAAGFSFKSRDSVDISVKVPPWFSVARADEIGLGGNVRALSYRSDGNQISIRLPNPGVGSIIWVHAAGGR